MKAILNDNINAVLEDIRAEIETESVKSYEYPNWERAKALKWALSVIDKYIEDKEKQNECKGNV